MKFKTRSQNQTFSEEIALQIFQDMDRDRNGQLDINEFMDAHTRAFKNCEENIEFIAADIAAFDEKIKGTLMWGISQQKKPGANEK